MFVAIDNLANELIRYIADNKNNIAERFTEIIFSCNLFMPPELPFVHFNTPFDCEFYSPFDKIVCSDLNLHIKVWNSVQDPNT